MKKDSKLPLIIEIDDGEFTGRIVGKGNFMPATIGATVDEVEANIRMLIADYQVNEGSNDAFWMKINSETVEFDRQYELEAFFENHDFLNITNVAKQAKLNPGLLRQYAAGTKSAGPSQVEKIQSAIRRLGQQMANVTLIS